MSDGIKDEKERGREETKEHSVDLGIPELESQPYDATEEKKCREAKKDGRTQLFPQAKLVGSHILIIVQE